MNERDIETLQEAKAYVYEQEDSIRGIIAPSDIRMQDIDQWNNADKELLREELAMSMGDAYTYPTNHPYSSLIERIAVIQYIDNLPSIRFKHLVFDTVEECVKNGIKPFGSELGHKNPDKWDMREIVYEVKDEIDYFHEYETEVRQEIEASILEARLKDF